MTPFAKQVYADMKSTDRILLWMIKCQELLELSEVMTEQDVKGMLKVCDLMEEAAHD